jgi:dTDP-N-acetylfucosamine:lipid II N-acetylfucosaminyltransferase
MILHIIDDEKFLVSAINLFENIFPGENIFLVGISNVSYNNFHDLKDLTCIYFKKIDTSEYEEYYVDLSKKVDFILFHNIYKTYKLKLLNKYAITVETGWTFWGAEFYGLNPFYEPLLPETKRTYLKSLPLKTYIKKTFFSRLKKYYYWYLLKKIFREDKLVYTFTNITEDIDLLESFTNCETIRGWFSYYNYNPQSKIEFDQALKKNILIGNSSSETNNHLDAFNLIKKIDLCNKEVYIPLNYGDIKYKDLVTKQATTIFKEQAKPITDFLSLQDYTRIINSCSVLIMNHKRQQGFNTIMMALANGCKVFIREENTIFKMLKREGFLVFSIQKDIQLKNALQVLTLEEQKFNLKLLEARYSKEIVQNRIKREFELIVK